jgi:PAS domain S-box-containing protein
VPAPHVLRVTGPTADAGVTAPAGGKHVALAELDALDARAIGAFDVAVIDAAEPIPALRRLRERDPTLQVVAVVEAEARARLQRTMLFTPGLGEVWLVEPGGADAALLERAASVTAARRDYRSTRSRMASELALIEPNPARRAVVSDAFLAALLQALPDPVVSLDRDGRILTWNVAAERLLGVPRAEALGRPFLEVTGITEDGAVDGDRGAGRTARRASYRRADGEAGSGELLRIPVEWGGRAITAVVLHDQTALHRSQAELEQQAVELESHAAELEAVNEELHQQSDALREALGARGRFYAAMSHELRTPINAIVGYQSLLLEGIYGALSDEQRNSLERAQRAASHLLELVNDVLDLAKIEAGRLDVRVEPVALPALLEELLDTVHSLAREHDVSLRLDGPAATHRIRSDPRRVRQILLNLLSNAVKFGAGRPVVIAWRPAGDGGAEIHIRDEGPGIAPADRDRIFREFEQVRTSETEPGAEGTGLGLAISARLAAILGGAIRLESEPGRGSTFTLVLPPEPPDAG